jgi:hypothetical protein
MSNVIHFPNAVQASRGALSLDGHVVKAPEGEKLLFGPWSYTCHKCSAQTTFQSENMIFRKIEFYCSSCGTCHKVVNPAFSNPPR